MLVSKFKHKILSVVASIGLCAGLSLGSSASFADAYKHRVTTAAYYDHSPKVSNLTVGKRYHRRGRNHSNSALGYLVGGVIIGSILADRNSNDGDRHSERYDQQSNQYWVDKYGDCFRLEHRDHGKIYVQTHRDECYQ